MEWKLIGKHIEIIGLPEHKCEDYFKIVYYISLVVRKNFSGKMTWCER